jgi:hypothetical protein
MCQFCVLSVVWQATRLNSPSRSVTAPTCSWNAVNLETGSRPPRCLTKPFQISADLGMRPLMERVLSVRDILMASPQPTTPYRKTNSRTGFHHQFRTATKVGRISPTINPDFPPCHKDFFLTGGLDSDTSATATQILSTVLGSAVCPEMQPYAWD